jgi:hypothetical protein
VKGKVIFTSDKDYEICRIKELSFGSHKKFYIFMNKFEYEPFFRAALPDFIFIPLKLTRSPQFSSMFVDNTQSDFFVLKNIRFSDLMDRDIEMHQMVLKGFKLIVDNHPFMGKSEVFWSYFLWSFFDKSLLGYPHSYAFRDAKAPEGIDPYDCQMLAKKVSIATETTIKTVFSDIAIERVALDVQAHQDYQILKRNLFETKTSAFEIVKGLRSFVVSKDSRLKTGFKLLSLNKVFDQFCQGERLLSVSNSKVDVYLEQKFWKYVNNVNTFMETLWNMVQK